jgi:hypothetical protein
MSRRIRWLTLAGVLITLSIALIWAKETLVWRDGEYHRLVRAYGTARSIDQQADVGFPPHDRWHQAVAISIGVTATIDVPDSLNPPATISYSDRPTVFQLYPPRDYTTVIDVRLDGVSLFVLRAVALVGTEHRLVMFDLIRREVVVDRRVDPNDVK